MMNAMEKFNINVTNLNESESEAIFVAEPLVRGYGITLGNALRRILLSLVPASGACQQPLACGCITLTSALSLHGCSLSVHLSPFRRKPAIALALGLTKDELI